MATMSPQALDVAVTYDAPSLHAAAALMFRKYLRSLLPIASGGLIALLLFTLWAWFYLHVKFLLWFPVLFLVADTVALVFARRRIDRRILKRLGKTAQIRLTDSDVSITGEGESHTLPWRRFRSVVADKYNLYLFASKTSAVILPIPEESAEARVYVISHVRTGTI